MIKRVKLNVSDLFAGLYEGFTKATGLSLMLQQFLKVVASMSYRKHQSPLEHRRVLSLAREYRSEGYEVTVYPRADELPEQLSKCPLDLIARGKDDVIAVEVRTRESLTLNGFEDLRRMAETIKQIPGWMFELVVTNPRKSRSSQ